MRKRLIILSALFAVATALCAQKQPEFSLRIHPIRGSFGMRDTITLEVTTTNLTDHKLNFQAYGEPYSFNVLHDGVPVPKITRPHPDLVLVDPKGIPAHRSVTGDVYANAYVDMSKPGRYTIQLQEGNIKSNIVSITVEP